MPTESSSKSSRAPRSTKGRKKAKPEQETSVENASTTTVESSRDEASGGPEDFGVGVIEQADGPNDQSGGDNNASGEAGDDSPKRSRRRRRRRPGGREDGSSGGNTRNKNAGGGGGGDNNRGRGRSRGGRGGQRQQPPNRQSAKSNVASTGQPVNEISGTIEGVLELHPKGYGFMRDASVNYASQDSDAFVSSTTVEKYGLREGILIKGEVGPGSRGQGPRLHEIISIDGRTPEEYAEIKLFDSLTAINPFEQIKLETTPGIVTMRVMDLLTPIGKGQRALIVAPPRTGKTMLLQDIANSVSSNHPEVHLIVLLIDERPEEVTEMRRLVNGEVIASSMDRDVESHVRTSQLIIERGKRIAEAGGDVFILLDSITRTARAFNKWVGNTGRTMTGGLDVKAMDIPKKMFGTARRFDEGGSLTVVGTALIDTGSRMDDVIFQEFKGTGNMELVLSRELADRRIWPAIDITRSGTRREEKILDPNVMEGVTALRRALISMSATEAMEELTRRLAMFPSNKEFLAKIRSVL
ncbi:transcription termination factor Rho [Rubinisphaera margarita]|uniref:transcription termination factor Rho n=1 Tax=Rubinisphaera margarita TaxID=2909586 RepID=UPI001EE92925|nr:transcription termination factor Rho [Rubinisphaera margarita]MCG6155443.1 transcription termination factor Rho [Rubinisphaera margarita]